MTSSKQMKFRFNSLLKDIKGSLCCVFKVSQYNPQYETSNNVLFDLILYVHSTIFQLCGTGSNNVVYATSKGSDQHAHTHRLIRAFASRLNTVKQLTEHHLEFLSLEEDAQAHSSASSHVKTPTCCGLYYIILIWFKQT